MLKSLFFKQKSEPDELLPPPPPFPKMELEEEQDIINPSQLKELKKANLKKSKAEKAQSKSKIKTSINSKTFDDDDDDAEEEIKNAITEQKLPEMQFDSISRMQKMINDAREHLMNLNLDAAKKSYIEILQLYNQISPQDQAKFYNDIRELYFERKSAEHLKI